MIIKSFTTGDFTIVTRFFTFLSCNKTGWTSILIQIFGKKIFMTTGEGGKIFID